MNVRGTIYPKNWKERTLVDSEADNEFYAVENELVNIFNGKIRLFGGTPRNYNFALKDDVSKDEAIRIILQAKESNNFPFSIAGFYVTDGQEPEDTIRYWF
ncbi:MAG TPA: hypothetical protein VF817_03500 [Patescibacteria group bacterium]